MIKVGIDTFGCDHGRSGLGSCLFYLAANLPTDDENISFELFGSESDRFTFTENNGFPYQAVQLADNPKAEGSWHHRSGIKFFVMKNNYDLVIYPAVSKVFPFTFIKNGIAIVNTVLSSAIEKMSFLHKKLLKHGLKNVKVIIAGTNYIKKDLKKLGIPEEKIRVIYNGIDHKLFYPKVLGDEEAVEVSPFSIKRPYFIYGSKLSDKNKKHIELIKAFEIFKKKTNLPHRLVLSGAEGACAESVRKTAMISPYASDIFITGYFPHESFPALYAGSEGCLFPSEIEGVGLPVLEAMATGVPVACSKAGALQEIAGEKAILFDSSNIEEIAASIEKIAVDNKLRKKMIKEGVEWAKKFDWQQTATETLEVLKSVIK